MSLLLRPSIDPTHTSMLTLVMGLAATKACNEVLEGRLGTGAPRVQVKWPNDLVLEGRKLAGILTELSTEVDYINYVVIGIGINVNTKAFPEGIAATANSLYLATGETFPRAELVARLLEYKMYKYMAQELLELEAGAGKHLYKAATVPKEVAKYEPPVDLDQLLGDLNLAKLQAVFESVMKRRADKIDPIRSRFGTIRREPISLETRIGSVMDYARSHRRFSFRQLLERQGDKLEVVVTFLAILELMKMGKIHLTQEELFDDMDIETLEPEGESGELDLEGIEDFEG